MRRLAVAMFSGVMSAAWTSNAFADPTVTFVTDCAAFGAYETSGIAWKDASLVGAPCASALFFDDFDSVMTVGLTSADTGIEARIPGVAGATDTPREGVDEAVLGTAGTSAVPEPTTLALLGLALAGIGYLWRRRNKAG